MSSPLHSAFQSPFCLTHSNFLRRTQLQSRRLPQARLPKRSRRPRRVHRPHELPRACTRNHDDDADEWLISLEDLFLEALRTYYQGTPMFTEAEFQALRDELDHLGSAQLRLSAMEKIWVQATCARDFDRRVRDEFEMSQDDLEHFKSKLLTTTTVKRPSIKPTQPLARIVRTIMPTLPLPECSKMRDAEKIDAAHSVDERLKWYVYPNPSLTNILSVFSRCLPYSPCFYPGFCFQMRAKNG